MENAGGDTRPVARSIRLNPALWNGLDAAAQKDGRSVNNLVEQLLERGIQGQPQMKLPPCDICGKDIRSPEEASIWVSYVELQDHAEKAAKWKAEHKGVYTLGDPDRPRRVKWKVGHTDCPDPTGDNLYWFDATRFETLGQALGWTLHLLEKTWLQDTDWDHLVRRLHKVPFA